MKKRNIAALLLNLYLTVSTIICFARLYFNGLSGNMEGDGFSILNYFTMESNIFLGLTSLLLIPFILRKMKNEKEIPYAVMVIRYTSVVSVTVTLLVACLFLSLFYGFGAMIEGENLYLHLMNPLVSIISLIFFENGVRLNKKAIFFGMLPVILYGALYYYEVVAIKNWADFYRFNQGGKWYIAVVAMGILDAILSSLIRFLYNRK